MPHILKDLRGYKQIKRFLKRFSREGFVSAQNAINSNNNMDKNELENTIYSLYVLGEGFFSFHESAQVSSFEIWLRSYQPSFYQQNLKAMTSISQLSSFNQLVEALYDGSIGFDNQDAIKKWFRRWYAESYPMFRLINDYGYFVVSESNHLLNVLYDINDQNIIVFNDSSDISQLEGLRKCQNNWFFDCFRNGSYLSKVFEIVVGNGTLPGASFKFISADGGMPPGVDELCRQYEINNIISLGFSKVAIEPNDPIVRDRFHRYDTFSSFVNEAGQVFFDLQAKCAKAKKFQDYYLLNVWSDKDSYNENASHINIAWGNRPISVWKRKNGFTTTVEEGARISIYRNDSGYPTIVLFPAQTETRKQKEDSIILRLRINPSRLLNNCYQKVLWRRLLAYMEVTSLDGDASFSQRCLIAWLRLVKHTIQDKQFMPRRISVIGLRILEFSLTVGLSGFLLKLIELFGGHN